MVLWHVCGIFPQFVVLGLVRIRALFRDCIFATACRLITRQITPRNPHGTSRCGQRGIRQSDVAARESRLAKFARDCLLRSLVSMYHLRWRARTGTPCLTALDERATSNRVHAMYFASLAGNTSGKRELITWRHSEGLFGSSKATCDRMSFISCDSEKTRSSRAENEPPDSECGLGMFGRQQGDEGSSVTVTSRLTGVPRSKPETSYRRFHVLVTREETVEKPDLLQTELTVDALMSCFFLFLEREMTSAAHGPRTQSVRLQILNCLSGRYTLQALHFKSLL